MICPTRILLVAVFGCAVAASTVAHADPMKGGVIAKPRIGVPNQVFAPTIRPTLPTGVFQEAPKPAPTPAPCQQNCPAQSDIASKYKQTNDAIAQNFK